MRSGCGQISSRSWTSTNVPTPSVKTTRKLFYHNYSVVHTGVIRGRNYAMDDRLGGDRAQIIYQEISPQNLHPSAVQADLKGNSATVMMCVNACVYQCAGIPRSGRENPATIEKAPSDPWKPLAPEVCGTHHPAPARDGGSASEDEECARGTLLSAPTRYG